MEWDQGGIPVQDWVGWMEQDRGRMDGMGCMEQDWGGIRWDSEAAPAPHGLQPRPSCGMGTGTG